MTSIKRVFYSYNSNLEGQKPYTLGVFVYEDGKVLESFDEQYASYEELASKIEETVAGLNMPHKEEVANGQES